LASEHIEDPTDNLIMCHVLSHARRHPAEPKAFLSANSKDFGKQDVKNTLRAADVEYFDRLREALKWLKPPPAPPTGPAETF